MLKRIFRRDRNRDGIAASLYGAIVTQSRSPAFYAELGVSDSVEGRFEMLILHLMILSRRLRSAGEEARSTGQTVFDLFCADMDRSLRDLGVGDLSVPRRMREVGAAYFGRVAAYEAGLAGSADLAGAIGRNIPVNNDSAHVSESLSSYVTAAAVRLTAQTDEAILSDGPDFPEPTTFFAGEEVV